VFIVHTRPNAFVRYTDDDDEKFWDAVDSLDELDPAAAATETFANHSCVHSYFATLQHIHQVYRDVLHRCNLHLKYVKHRPPFDGSNSEHAVEFNADVLKISMSNDQYWDLMLLLDWFAAFDELRISVALERLVCCDLTDEMLPPNRMCGFRKRYADREPCGNFAMYSSLPANAMLLGGEFDRDAENSCEYRCGVHIDQTTSSLLNNCQPYALFEKQDFTSFVAEDDAQHGPSKPIPMTDFTEECTAVMMANAIFQLCFSEINNMSIADTSSSAAVQAAVVSASSVSSSAPSLSIDDHATDEQGASDQDLLSRDVPDTQPSAPSNGSEHVLRHAKTELRAFMEHLGVQYCLNSECAIYGRPKPATHPLLSSYASAYLSDIVRSCCLNKKRENVSLKSIKGAQRGKPFFGLVAHNLLEKCKEWLKNTTPQKGWLAYFTSWGKTELMSPSKVPSAADSSRPKGSLADGDSGALSGITAMPADLNDPEDDRSEGIDVAGTGAFDGGAWSQQFCFKADILRIELHLLVLASEQCPAVASHDPSPHAPSASQPKSLALIFCGPREDQPAFSLVHYVMQLGDELSDAASVSSSGRTRLTSGSGDGHRYCASNVESRTCILIAEIETSDVSQNLLNIYSLDRASAMSQRSGSSDTGQSSWHQCPWAQNFVPPHFEERNPGDCFLYIDQVQFRGQNTADVQEAPKLCLSINPRLVVLSPVDLVVLSEFFAQPSSVVFNYERKMAIKTRLREGTAAASPPTLEEPANIVSKNLVKLDVSIKFKSPRIIIPCKIPSSGNSSRCVLVIDMASLTLNSR
jgi:hypothetical protein